MPRYQKSTFGSIGKWSEAARVRPGEIARTEVLNLFSSFRNTSWDFRNAEKRAREKNYAPELEWWETLALTKRTAIPIRAGLKGTLRGHQLNVTEIEPTGFEVAGEGLQENFL